MMKLARLIAVSIACASLVPAGEWSAPVDVLHELKPCVTYRARIDGEFLVIEAALQPGWHTFAIDNEQRAAEKRAGKPSLGIDQPTQVKLVNGLELTGPWYQSPPKDFSRPQLRWFSWGFEQQARFAAKVRRSGSGPAQIGIRGQACTETVCKNIDVSLSLIAAGATKDPSDIDLKTLVQAR
jgi:hypothetical protein